jgi:hypothetical protein
MRGRSNTYAFTIVELLIVAAIILIFLVLLWGLQIASENPRHRKQIYCRNNLKQIAIAFRTFSIDQADSFSTQIPVKFGGSADLVPSGQVFVHFRVMSNELGTPKLLVCPVDQAKAAAETFTNNFSDANVSYFIGTDAKDTMTEMLLSGDRNLEVGGVPVAPGLFILTTNLSLGWTREIHDSCGNVALADGSVQFFQSPRLALQVRLQGIATNRLVVP